MQYAVVASDFLAELIQKVNDYQEIGWYPVGGVTAIRERTSGPVTFYQAVFNNGSAPKTKTARVMAESYTQRKRGWPLGKKRKKENGTDTNG